MSYETLILERQGRVALIRLNRPQALNALNAKLMEELSACVEMLDQDDDVGCVVLTGSTKAFAAGADIKEMALLTYADAFKTDLFTATSEKIVRARKPIIAAVAGYALGGGCELAMILTGRMMDASEAERSGLVARVVPADKLIEEAMAAAAAIAALSPLAVMMNKELVETALETTLTQGVKTERRLFQSMFAFEDQKEGMAAFVEKRKPEFRGR
jgi:enoyl-CoA hydratase/carnithine racemase